MSPARGEHQADHLRALGNWRTVHSDQSIPV